MKQRPIMSIAAVALAVGMTSTGFSQNIDREALSNAVDSVVFLRMNRTFRNAYFTSSGTGFFAHPDGYVITNWHVVADTVEVNLDGVSRDINAKVLDLEVVVHSGTDRERVVPAKIVALDRSRDLALLRVAASAPAYLDVTGDQPVEVTDQVWVIGFPLGEMLAVGNQTRPVGAERNPEVSVNTGMVTSLRRDENGKLAMVQTDAAVNPGNSGGPLINNSGQVVGVVNAKIMRTEGLGFAISPTVLGEFVASRAASVSFHPGVIPVPPAPIRIVVTPILADLGPGLTASVTLTGDDIRPITGDLNVEAGEWQGTLPAPEPIEGAEAPDFYIAEITFTRPDGRTVMHRRFQLQNIAATGFAINTQRDPARVMADRREFANERNMRRGGSAQSKGGKSSLSDYAKKKKISGDGGPIVIDQYKVAELGNPLLRKLPPERYEHLDDETVFADVARFDVCRLAKNELERARAEAAKYLDSPDWRTRGQAAKANAEIDTYWDPVMICYEKYRERVVSHDVVFCQDDDRWYHRHALPECRWPQEP